MNRILDLLWLRVLIFFKHPPENIRQAKPIKPGRFYENYGYICKAVKYSDREQLLVNSWLQSQADSFDPHILIDQVQGIGIRNKDKIQQLQEEVSAQCETSPGCQFCDFAHAGIPCPIYNELKDGSTVCNTHKYIILKRPVR